MVLCDFSFHPFPFEYGVLGAKGAATIYIYNTKGGDKASKLYILLPKVLIGNFLIILHKTLNVFISF